MGDRRAAIGKFDGPTDVGRRVARLAAGQHGVVTSAQLRELGLGPKAIKWRVATGRLHSVHRGVYAVGHTSVSRRGQYLAAVLACGHKAALSHRSAADLWGLRRELSRIEITLPRGRAGHPGIVAHRSRMMDAGDFASLAGIRVTDVARTLLDLATVVSRAELARAVDHAERRELFDLNAVEELLSHCGGRAGAAALRRTIATWRPSHTRSELEDRFLELVGRAGLPAPVVNGLVAGYEVDFHWPAKRLVVETDGRSFHDTAQAFERDRQRDLDLELAGWRVVRISWRQLVERPGRVTAMLRTRLCER